MTSRLLSLLLLVSLLGAVPDLSRAQSTRESAPVRQPLGAGVPSAVKPPAAVQRQAAHKLTPAAVLRLGQPPSGELRVYYYFRKYDEGMKKLVQTSGAYHSKRSECAQRGFSAQEQAAAGCQPSDTVSACAEKLVTWCTAAERAPYEATLSEVVAAATRLSQEAQAEAKARSNYLRMR